MSKPRVVLDTNVVISGVINPTGLEAEIVVLIAVRELELYASKAVIAEYEIVFARPKFAHIDPARITHFLRLLKAEAKMVTPRDIVTESKDDADNRFLECAETADAQYLVTGNKRHFPAQWKSTRIVNARELFQIIR